MQQRLLHRLQKLECIIVKLRPIGDTEQESLVPEIVEFLELQGIAPGPKESLAAAFGRALGISYEELQGALETVG